MPGSAATVPYAVMSTVPIEQSGAAPPRQVAGAEATPWLSVVLPVRDEIGALPMLVDELFKALAQLDAGFELIFVDDASRDGSLSWLGARSVCDERVRVIALDSHMGQASALDAGFRAARGELIATLDADGQNDPADLPMLVRRLECARDVDVICGVRVTRHDAAGRRWASRLANALRNRWTHEDITDVGCSLRVMRAPFVHALKLERGLHRFLPTLLRLEGARIAEVPVTHRPRVAGRSKYGVLDRLPEAVRDLWVVGRRVRRARESTRDR